jgi:rhodanese-related sulfurtransferase
MMKYEDLLAHNVPEFLQQPELLVLDIRDEHSFNQAHLDGAQPASEAVIGGLLRNKQYHLPILVYCYHGNSSRDMASFLGGLGFDKVYNLEGGWQAWTNFLQQQQPTSALSPELTQWLTQAGFDPANLNSRIDNAMSALMLAALQGETEIAQALLAAGADVNLLNDDENNALWFACVSDSIDLLHLFSFQKVNLDHQNVNGATSLIYAASAGKLEVVKTLVGLGADVGKTTLDGFSALDSATTLPILQFLKPYYAAA